MNASNENITFLEVDCDQFQTLCEDNNIEGYPTFYFITYASSIP